jgi:nucleotide-binding universal stress UspA family protein
MSTFPTKILLSTDGSQDAALAARAAIDLSNRSGAQLHVVYAWQHLRPGTIPAIAMDEYSRAHEQWKREAGEFLEEQAQRLRSAGGTVTGAHLREGRPAEEITELAEELNVSLVVIGSRGLGPVKRLVMGSVSEGVVHLAHCPTLVVRGGDGSWPPSRLIIGDDASEEARRAGELAASIGVVRCSGAVGAGLSFRYGIQSQKDLACAGARGASERGRKVFRKTSSRAREHPRDAARG